eukprot:g3324.t1
MPPPAPAFRYKEKQKTEDLVVQFSVLDAAGGETRYESDFASALLVPRFCYYLLRRTDIKAAAAHHSGTRRDRWDVFKHFAQRHRDCIHERDASTTKDKENQRRWDEKFGGARLLAPDRNAEDIERLRAALEAIPEDERKKLKADATEIQAQDRDNYNYKQLGRGSGQDQEQKSEKITNKAAAHSARAVQPRTDAENAVVRRNRVVETTAQIVQGGVSPSIIVVAGDVGVSSRLVREIHKMNKGKNLVFAPHVLTKTGTGAKSYGPKAKALAAQKQARPPPGELRLMSTDQVYHYFWLHHDFSTRAWYVIEDVNRRTLLKRLGLTVDKEKEHPNNLRNQKAGKAMARIQQATSDTLATVEVKAACVHVEKDLLGCTAEDGDTDTTATKESWKSNWKREYSEDDYALHIPESSWKYFQDLPPDAKITIEVCCSKVWDEGGRSRRPARANQELLPILEHGCCIAGNSDIQETQERKKRFELLMNQLARDSTVKYLRHLAIRCDAGDRIKFEEAKKLFLDAGTGEKQEADAGGLAEAEALELDDAKAALAIAFEIGDPKTRNGDELQRELEAPLALEDAKDHDSVCESTPDENLGAPRRLRCSKCELCRLLCDADYSLYQQIPRPSTASPDGGVVFQCEDIGMQCGDRHCPSGHEVCELLPAVRERWSDLAWDSAAAEAESAGSNADADDPEDESEFLMPRDLDEDGEFDHNLKNFATSEPAKFYTLERKIAAHFGGAFAKKLSFDIFKSYNMPIVPDRTQTLVAGQAVSCVTTAKGDAQYLTGEALFVRNPCLEASDMQKWTNVKAPKAMRRFRHKGLIVLPAHQATMERAAAQALSGGDYDGDDAIVIDFKPLSPDFTTTVWDEYKDAVDELGSDILEKRARKFSELVQENFSDADFERMRLASPDFLNLAAAKGKFSTEWFSAVRALGLDHAYVKTLAKLGHEAMDLAKNNRSVEMLYAIQKRAKADHLLKRETIPKALHLRKDDSILTRRDEKIVGRISEFAVDLLKKRVAAANRDKQKKDKKGKAATALEAGQHILYVHGVVLADAAEKRQMYNFAGKLETDAEIKKLVESGSTNVFKGLHETVLPIREPENGLGHIPFPFLFLVQELLATVIICFCCSANVFEKLAVLRDCAEFVMVKKLKVLSDKKNFEQQYWQPMLEQSSRNASSRIAAYYTQKMEYFHKNTAQVQLTGFSLLEFKDPLLQTSGSSPHGSTDSAWGGSSDDADVKDSRAAAAEQVVDDAGGPERFYVRVVSSEKTTRSPDLETIEKFVAAIAYYVAVPSFLKAQTDLKRKRIYELAKRKRAAAKENDGGENEKVPATKRARVVTSNKPKAMKTTSKGKNTKTKMQMKAAKNRKIKKPKGKKLQLEAGDLDLAFGLDDADGPGGVEVLEGESVQNMEMDSVVPAESSRDGRILSRPNEDVDDEVLAREHDQISVELHEDEAESGTRHLLPPGDDGMLEGVPAVEAGPTDPTCELSVAVAASVSPSREEKVALCAAEAEQLLKMYDGDFLRNVPEQKTYKLWTTMKEDKWAWQSVFTLYGNQLQYLKSKLETPKEVKEQGDWSSWKQDEKDGDHWWKEKYGDSAGSNNWWGDYDNDVVKDQDGDDQHQEDDAAGSGAKAVVAVAMEKDAKVDEKNGDGGESAANQNAPTETRKVWGQRNLKRKADNSNKNWNDQWNAKKQKTDDDKWNQNSASSGGDNWSRNDYDRDWNKNAGSWKYDSDSWDNSKNSSGWGNDFGRWSSWNEYEKKNYWKDDNSNANYKNDRWRHEDHTAAATDGRDNFAGNDCEKEKSSEDQWKPSEDLHHNGKMNSNDEHHQSQSNHAKEGGDEKSSKQYGDWGGQKASWDGWQSKKWHNDHWSWKSTSSGGGDSWDSSKNSNWQSSSHDNWDWKHDGHGGKQKEKKWNNWNEHENDQGIAPVEGGDGRKDDDDIKQAGVESNDKGDDCSSSEQGQGDYNCWGKFGKKEENDHPRQEGQHWSREGDGYGFDADYWKNGWKQDDHSQRGCSQYDSKSWHYNSYYNYSSKEEDYDYSRKNQHERHNQQRGSHSYTKSDYGDHNTGWKEWKNQKQNEKYSSSSSCDADADGDAVMADAEAASHVSAAMKYEAKAAGALNEATALQKG